MHVCVSDYTGDRRQNGEASGDSRAYTGAFKKRSISQSTDNIHIQVNIKLYLVNIKPLFTFHKQRIEMIFGQSHT